MSFGWFSYLDVAHELHVSALGTALEEAKLRSAISRAYYAVFNEGRTFLIRRLPNMYIPEDGRAHVIVSDRFTDDPGNNADWISVGVKMSRLRRARNKADYTSSVANLLPLVELCLLEAVAAITTLRTL